MLFEDRLDELTPEQRELFELFLKKERLTVSAAKGYRAPATDIERSLTAIWSELLGVDAGVDDNYFELGGDSITIIRMVSRARSEGIALKTEWVFSHPTIAELATMCEPGRPADSSAGLPEPVRASAAEDLARLRDADPDLDRILQKTGATAVDAYPLTPVQQGILFHALDGPFEGCYAVQWRFRLRGRLDPIRFERAWAATIARHEVLRTIFRWVGLEEPMQVVLDRAEGVIVNEVDTDVDTAADADAAGEWSVRAAEVMEQERRRELDLQTAPLMRIRFVRRAADEWLCVWTHHHLILDGWSQQIFLQEFFAAYREQPLPPVVPGLFRDHVHRVRALHGDAAAAFWRQWFAGHQPAERQLQLPSDNASASVHTVWTRTIPNARQLRDVLRRQAITVSVLYQAAWALAMAQLLEHDDVVFGVASSGRSSAAPGIERAVGLFIDTVPFRTTVDRSMTFTTFVEEVQRGQAALLAYEGCGMLAIQKWIGWDRRAPLVSSLYVYERFPLDLSELKEREGLAVFDVETTTHEHYPLVCVVQDDDETTKITVKHTASDADTVERIERAFELLTSIATRLIEAAESSETPETASLMVRDIIGAGVVSGEIR